MMNCGRNLDFRLRPPAHRGYRGLRPGGILDFGKIGIFFETFIVLNPER